ncbi:hypothetical protein Tco_0502959, partial [Tanacetum coccineum]
IAWICICKTVGFLRKPDESVGFAEIVDFLRGSNLRYALTTNPTIYDSLVKQFWQTATANTLADGTLELQETIDTIVYTITEASIRNKLQLADASGITMLPNNKIFEGMGHMGAIVKLVKKVKNLEGILKRRTVVLSDSEEEESEAQGKKSQDDHLVSLVQGLVTPFKTTVNALGEEQTSAKFGEDLQTKTSKRLKVDEAKDVLVYQKYWKERKQIARKDFILKKTEEDELKASKDADHISGTNIPVNPVHVAIKPLSIATYKIIKQGKEGGKPDEDCYKLLKWMKKQAGIRKPLGYGILNLLDMAYWTYWVWLMGYVLRTGVLYYLGKTYRVFVGYMDIAESVLFFNKFDQSIIYDVYTDVDTVYSSKSGNGPFDSSKSWIRRIGNIRWLELLSDSDVRFVIPPGKANVVLKL